MRISAWSSYVFSSYLGIGGGDRADLLAHPLRQRLAQIVVGGDADVERHISINALTLDVVGEADHRGLGDQRVEHQRAFDLGGAHAVADRKSTRLNSSH